MVSGGFWTNMEYKMGPVGLATVHKADGLQGKRFASLANRLTNGLQACKPCGQRLARLVSHMANGIQACKPISGQNWTES